MADILTSDKRSRNMSAIKNRDTKPEIYFRKLLFAQGFRYRKNSSSIIGHPDLYLAKYHTAVFINGCFWHRHTACKYAYTPKSRIDFWQKKFEHNIQRDATVRAALANKGIKCLVVWECTIRKMERDSLFETDILHSAIDFILSDSSLFLEL